MRYLSQFLADLRGGFQDNNRFDVQLYVPQGLLQSVITDSAAQQALNILLPTIGQRFDPTFSAAQVASWLARGIVCEAATIPSRSFECVDMAMYGFGEKFPYHSDFPAVDCTFLTPLAGTDNSVPRFFNYWLNYIHAAQAGVQDGMDFRFPADYYGTMLLTQYTRTEHPSITYKFERVYPKVVQSTPVAWATTDTHTKTSIQFNYSWYEILPYQPPPLIELDINF